MRIALLSAVVLAAIALDARADVGPIAPARRICMGQPDGAPCELDGQKGACHGPHPSRMYCEPLKDGSAAPAPTPPPAPAPAPTPTPAPSAGSAAPANEPTPGHKRGCAVAEPGSAMLLGLALLALRRRRRSA